MEEKTQRSEIPNHVGYYADMQGNIYNSKGVSLFLKHKETTLELICQ